jgi:hypothetical protein
MYSWSRIGMTPAKRRAACIKLLAEIDQLMECEAVAA